MGEFLRSHREAAGLTQSDVSHRLGYGSPQFISNWERGVSLPPLEVVPVLTRLYGIEPRVVIDAFQKLHAASTALKIKALEQALKKGAGRSVKRS